MKSKPALHKGDETDRRWKIIAASRARDSSRVAELLRVVRNKNETYANRRHAVRALGNIGGPIAGEALLRMLEDQRGEMLAEVAQAAGKLRLRAAAPRLEALREHESEWVRNNASFALRQIGRNPRRKAREVSGDSGERPEGGF